MRERFHSWLGRHEKDKEPYHFFEYEEERKNVFEYSKRIAEFLHDKRIPNLAIVDRSSRPLYVGVLEYWRAKYKNEKRPDIYFFNPKGFTAREDFSEDEINDICWEALSKDDAQEDPDQARSRDEILRELRTTYKALVRDKDKPLLVFDTCIHSGDTLSPVIDALDKEGFSNVIVGSVMPSDSESRVHSTFFITRQRPKKGCYPFSNDRMIEKTLSHVYSTPTEDVDKIHKGRQLRQEIKSN